MLQGLWLLLPGELVFTQQSGAKRADAPLAPACSHSTDNGRVAARGRSRSGSHKDLTTASMQSWICRPREKLPACESRRLSRMAIPFLRRSP